MNAQLAIQNLLRSKLGEFQRKNPSYSLRAFSQKVGVHVGALSSIMNGKRNVSRELAERIVNRLFLDPQERSEVLDWFPQTVVKKGVSTGEVLEPRYLQFNADQFKIVAEWEHFAFLSLMKCKDFQSNIRWVSERLGITQVRAQAVVKRLIELEIVILDSQTGELTRAEKSYRTPDDVVDTSLKKSHEESMELAKESLYRDPIERRDFTSLTMAIDPKKLSMAKELVRKFQDEISDLLETGNQTEVYRLSMQFFPLTTLNEMQSGENK